MTLRERLREMGLLDFCLALCAEQHVALDALIGSRRQPGPNTAKARTKLYVYLRSVGMSWSEIGEVVGLDHTTVLHAVKMHGPGLAKVVPIRGAGDGR